MTMNIHELQRSLYYGKTKLFDCLEIDIPRVSDPVNRIIYFQTNQNWRIKEWIVTHISLHMKDFK